MSFITKCQNLPFATSVHCSSIAPTLVTVVMLDASWQKVPVSNAFRAGNIVVVVVWQSSAMMMIYRDIWSTGHLQLRLQFQRRIKGKFAVLYMYYLWFQVMGLFKLHKEFVQHSLQSAVVNGCLLVTLEAPEVEMLAGPLLWISQQLLFMVPTCWMLLISHLLRFWLKSFNNGHEIRHIHSCSRQDESQYKTSHNFLYGTIIRSKV